MPRRVIVIDRCHSPSPHWAGRSPSPAERLNDAIDAQVKARCVPHLTPSCRLGYAPLGELRHYYGVR